MDTHAQLCVGTSTPGGREGQKGIPLQSQISWSGGRRDNKWPVSFVAKQPLLLGKVMGKSPKERGRGTESSQAIVQGRAEGQDGSRMTPAFCPHFPAVDVPVEMNGHFEIVLRKCP